MEPRYRFKEFIGILSNTVEVSEICTTTRKTVFPEKTPDLTFAEYSMPAYDEGKTPSIVKGSEIHSSRIKIDKPVLLVNKLNVRKKRIWNVEDPLKNAVCSGEFVPLVSNKITLAYLQYLFETEKVTSYFVGCSTGTSNSQKRILPEIIYNLTIDLPSKEEQQKIADFLSSYDEKIRLQRERVESLERRKKGLLQKVFRQEIRFKDDDGKEFTEWMTRTYSDVMDGFEYGLPYPSVKFDGINKYLRITDIDDITRRYQIEGCVSPGGIIRDNYKLVEGDILFARTGATVGKTYIYSKNDGNVYYAGYLIKGHVKKDYVPYFVFCTTFTNEYWNYIKETSMRTGQPGVNSKEFASYKFKCPNYEEQKKIAKLFTAIDDQINIERERLSTMETIKKGLLQGLFC